MVGDGEIVPDRLGIEELAAELALKRLLRVVASSSAQRF